MRLFKRGISKLQITIGFIFLILILVTIVFADTSNKNSDKNLQIVSETKNNIKVTWYPVHIGLMDKEYNLTVENLESRQRNLDLDALLKSISGGLDTILLDSLKLSYLTDFTTSVDNYVQTCTTNQVILSQGEPNQTTASINTCAIQNNPETITYKGWKEYSTEEVRDKNKQEISLHKKDNNGKIILSSGGNTQLNLKFKTKIISKSDGTWGNDGEVILLLDGVSYHPTFNISYNKRYLVNITANDAIDTNYTHNLTFAFTGNSNEIGSGNYNYGNASLSACNNVHVFFNGTTELDAWIEGCNSSSFRIYFRNQNNMTKNGTALNQYEIYYDPSGTNYQRPQDWGAIWLPLSDNFAAGLNTSRWIVDNTTADGNSSWFNISGTDGIIEIRGGAENPGPDGCFRSSYNNGVNFSQRNWGMDLLWIRHAGGLTGVPNNRAYGISDRPCGGSPNSDGTGAFVYGDAPTQADNIWGIRRIFAGSGFGTPTTTTGATSQGYWTLIHLNTTHFPNNRSSLNWNNSYFTEGAADTPDESRALGVLVREAYDVAGDNSKVTRVDFVRVYQILGAGPLYTVYQENKSTGTTVVNVSAQSCTAEDRESSPNTYNTACDGTYPAPCGINITNDLLTCDDEGVETRTFKKDKFSGLHIQSFNSSITNCQSINNVTLCYKWWVSGDSLKNCTVAVDANANSSYSVASTTCPVVANATCPEAGPSPTLNCIDVTSLESWTCSNFFGSAGTRAVARNELSTSDSGHARVLRTNVLYFNVNYTKTA